MGRIVRSHSQRFWVIGGGCSQLSQGRATCHELPDSAGPGTSCTSLWDPPICSLGKHHVPLCHAASQSAQDDVVRMLHAGPYAEEFGIAGSGVWSWHSRDTCYFESFIKVRGKFSCLLVPTGTVLKDVFGVGLLRGPRRGVDQRANFYSKPPRHVDATPRGARNRSSPCRGLVFCIYISASRAGSDETSGVGRWISSDGLPR